MSAANNIKPHTMPGKMEVPYRNYVGEMASDFYVKLRDEMKLCGAKCPKCGHIYMPPQSICGDCFVKMTELVELKGKGTLVTFTEVHYKEPNQPVEPPFVYGIVKLDGADTGMLHMIGECRPADLKIGMRVQAVIAEKRAGNILDIKYFKPVKE
jgi:uncharacterized OB-fold protein